jgi:adenylate cyclase class 2
MDILKTQSVVLSEPIVQHDRVFSPGDVDNHSSERKDASWLRIRAETKNDKTKHIFTLKKSVTTSLDNVEHETEVLDERELERIIHHLGFTPFSDITKTRQKAMVGDIEICVDAVDGLGDFIEAESLTGEDVDYEAVVAKLWMILERFGVSREDNVTDGYDVLMNKHRADK